MDAGSETPELLLILCRLSDHKPVPHLKSSFCSTACRVVDYLTIARVGVGYLLDAHEAAVHANVDVLQILKDLGTVHSVFPRAVGFFIAACTCRGISFVLLKKGGDFSFIVIWFYMFVFFVLFCFP